jgi:branched-chain amino acid transport system permease protein
VPPLQASPLDGEWRGRGTAGGGKQFVITFSVQGERLAGILFTFKGSDGLSCTGIEYGQIPLDQRPSINESSISASLGEDFSITASFPDIQTSSGQLIVHWHDRQPRCNGDYEVQWTAEKSLPVSTADGGPTPNAHPFATFFQILVFGLSNGSVLALNAIGVTIIYSTVRTLNLAHGDVFALTTALVTSIINAAGINQGWPLYRLVPALVLVLLAAISLAALLSMGIDQFGFKPFRGSSRLAPLIATLGLSFILFQAALVWRTFQGSWIPGEHRSVPGIPEVPTDGIPSLLPEINLAVRLGIPNLVIRFGDVFVLLMALGFVVLAAWFLRGTRTGRAIQALAQNPQMAQMVGVNVDGTIRRAFAVGGAFAGAAAFIFALYYSRPFGAHGAQSGLMAFAAALLGGIGSPSGALLSGWLIGVFSSFSDYYLKAQWTPVFLLALLVALLAWRPAGLVAPQGDLSTGAPVRDSVVLPAAAAGPRSRHLPLFLLAVLVVFPVLAAVFGWGGQVVLRTVGIFILLTLGLNLALGVAGLLDFGFAAGFGLGAYAGALLSRFDGFLALLAGVIMGGLLGALKGGLARRLRGDFLAVSTLTLGLLVRQASINLSQWTGGAGGLGGFPSLHFLGWKLTDPDLRFYLVLLFVILTAVGGQRLLVSRTGRAFISASEDEGAAEAAGVDVNRARLQALVISSALAGLAGALYAGTFSYVDPELMSFHVSSLILTMVILGGAGNIPGAILGAAAIVLYDKVFVPRLADLAALIWPSGLAIGSAPDIRGASFFNFGIALYLTVLIRAHRRKA